MQYLRNLYLLSGMPYSVSVSVHAVTGKNGIVLFDTGTDEGEMEIVDRNLKYWGLDTIPITDVFITHSHMDHSGNAKLLRDRGARIIAGPIDADAIEKGDERTIDFALLREFKPCPVDVIAQDEEVIETRAGISVKCFHTPGHSPGSMLYRVDVDGKQVMFTGDTIRVGEFCETGVLGWTGGPDVDIPTYIKSLGRAARLKCDVVCGGHFLPCMEDGWKILCLTYRRALEDLRLPRSL